MKKNREELRRVMFKHDLKGPGVAEIVDRSHFTVRIWMARTGRDIPDEMLKKLKASLGESADYF